MQSIEKANYSLRESLRYLHKRIDAIFPLSLCTCIQNTLAGESTTEPIDFSLILSNTLEQIKDARSSPRHKPDPKKQYKGKTVEYLKELMHFYKELIMMLENGITKKMGEFLNTFVKKFQEQRKKASGEVSAGMSDSMHTLKTLNANFPSLEVKQALSNIVCDEHKLQLGLILMLSLVFALYLRSSPLIQRNPPKNFKEILSLLDSESLETTSYENGNSAFAQETLRICFVEILTPILETGIHGLKGHFELDVVIEYYLLIGFFLDSFSNASLYSESIKRTLGHIPISSSLRILIVSYMNSPLESQKKAYADHLTFLLAEKQAGIVVLLDVIVNSNWPLSQVKQALGKILTSSSMLKCNYYLTIVMQLFKALYFNKSIQIKDKKSVISKAKSNDECLIALYLLGKIQEEQPDLGKKIIVRKFLLKFYDLALIDLLTLKRDCIVSDVGSKFRNMNMKGISVKALTKDMKMLIRFLNMMDSYPASFFGSMNECYYSFFGLYVGLNRALFGSFHNALKELLKIYLAADGVDPFEESIPQNILRYMLHEVDDYVAHLKAYHNYMLHKSTTTKDLDTEGLGNIAISKASPKVAMSALCRCLKAYADKRRGLTPSEKDQSSPIDKVLPSAAKLQRRSEAEGSIAASQPAPATKRAPVELCEPYSFTNDVKIDSGDIIFVKLDSKGMIEGGYFCISTLNKAAQGNNQLLELLISLKSTAKAARIIRALFIESLKMVIDIKSGCDLVPHDEIADAIEKVSPENEDSKVMIEEIRENKDRIKEYSIALLLTVCERLAEHACAGGLFDENAELISVIISFLKKTSKENQILKVVLIILHAGLRSSSAGETLPALLKLRLEELKAVVEEIAKSESANEDIKDLAETILKVLPENMGNTEKVLSELSLRMNEEIAKSSSKEVEGIAKILEKYEGLVDNDTQKTIYDRLIEYSASLASTFSISFSSTAAKSTISKNCESLANTIVKFCEINLSIWLRKLIASVYIKEGITSTALPFLQALLILIKKGAGRILTDEEGTDLLLWTLEQYSKDVCATLFLELGESLCRKVPMIVLTPVAKFNEALLKVADIAKTNVQNEAYPKMIYTFGSQRVHDLSKEVIQKLQEAIGAMGSTTQNKLAAVYCKMIKADIVDKILSQTAP